MTGRGRGRLIALEGVDGCGKSTQAALLADRLGALCTFEPGATELGRYMRALVLTPSVPEVSARAETLLLLADRAQHVAEQIGPALAEGRWVVTDRFSASTLAYQGAGRGLDVGELRALVAWATGGIEPDLNLLVDVPVEVAAGRRAAAGADADDDRLETLDPEFHGRVAAGFRDQAAADAAHWAVVDGTGTVDEVAARIAAAVAERLGEPPTPPAPAGRGNDPA